MKTQLSLLSTLPPKHTHTHTHTHTLASPSIAAKLSKFLHLCSTFLLKECPSSGTEARPQMHSHSRFVSTALFLPPAISEHITALCLFSIVPPSHLFFIIFSTVLQMLSSSPGLINLLFLSSGAVVSARALQEGPPSVVGSQSSSSAHTPAPGSQPDLTPMQQSFSLLLLFF